MKATTAGARAGRYVVLDVYTVRGPPGSAGGCRSEQAGRGTGTCDVGARMAAPDAVNRLVERFDRDQSAYLNSAYNETQLRREFLDPFFKALGWDVDNAAGHAPQYRDVVHEDAIKVGIETRAPDYSFRVGGQRKFFVEAKKPAVNLKDDPAPACQLRRYAWSGKLPLSVLHQCAFLTRPLPRAGTSPIS